MQPHRKLEVEVARWIDADPEQVAACSSGTAALHLAFECLGLPAGSTVLCPDLTMVACPRAISMAGLAPHFVDCRREDLLVDLDLLDDAAGLGASAVLAVHLYGRVVPMDQVEAVADKHGLAVVEDLAEAHGVRPHGGTAAACWSFYRNKVVCGEEGGAVWFRDPERARQARRLRSLGFTEAHDFWHEPRGHNYRMADLLAVPILASLSVFDQLVYVRRVVERSCDELCPEGWRMPPRDSPWVYDFRVPGLEYPRQDEVVRALREIGVEARHCFKPCSRLKEYRGSPVTLAGRSEADVASREVLYLPLTMTGGRARVYEAFAVARSVLGDPA